MFSKITESLLKNKGIQGLPDVPGLSTSDMQAKFDELSLDVIVPFINSHIEELEDYITDTDGNFSYKIATDSDIDAIIAGTFVETTEDDLITDNDTSDGENESDDTTDDSDTAVDDIEESITDEELDDIVDNSFEEE